MRKRRFAECMILGWQNVEDGINQMMIDEFHLIYSPDEMDPRVDLIRGINNIRIKTEFLEDMGRLSRGDLKVIADFDKERNKLFHGFIYESTHPVTIPEAEKTRLMQMADRASKIITNRGFGVWFEEGTTDTGNKDVPRPQRPSGSDFADEQRRKVILKWDEEEREAERLAHEDPDDNSSD